MTIGKEVKTMMKVSSIPTNTTFAGGGPRTQEVPIGTFCSK